VSTKPEPSHPWQFVRRFRRGGFGWRSAVAVPAVREALKEIKSVARSDPAAAAEGAVRFLERVSPALEHVDSSSGAMGSAVNQAVSALAEIIGDAPLETSQRARLLDRLWKALEDERMGYLDLLEDLWGRCCGSPEVASSWSDGFVDVLRGHLKRGADGYLRGSVACLSALYAARRYDELFSLLESERLRWWNYREWGFKALVALGRPGEALRYAEACRGINDFGAIDAACERLLLERGLEEEAYTRYGMAAAPSHATNLATFRAMRKKYPRLDPAVLLRDLAARTPGKEGRWFAAAVSAELYDLALTLARTSPADPKTLTRASRDRSSEDPAFSLAAAELALESVALGYGFELSASDVIDAYRLGAQAAERLGSTLAYDQRVREIADSGDAFTRKALALVGVSVANAGNSAVTKRQRQRGTGA
jgi:hypothetical protein